MRVVALPLLLALLISSLSEACKCRLFESKDARLEDATSSALIFTGVVTAIRPQEYSARHLFAKLRSLFSDETFLWPKSVYEVRLTHRFKRETGTHVEIVNPRTSCPTPELELGVEYLIYAAPDHIGGSPFPAVDGCSPSARVEYSPEEIEWLRARTKG